MGVEGEPGSVQWGVSVVTLAAISLGTTTPINEPIARSQRIGARTWRRSQAVWLMMCRSCLGSAATLARSRARRPPAVTNSVKTQGGAKISNGRCAKRSDAGLAKCTEHLVAVGSQRAIRRDVPVRTQTSIRSTSSRLRVWARLMHRRSDSLIEDAMIAATAAVHNLTVVTRQERPFLDGARGLAPPPHMGPGPRQASRSALASRKSGRSNPSLNRPCVSPSIRLASGILPCFIQRRPRLVTARNSSDFAP